MARIKTAAHAARRWSAAFYAACRRGLTHLARRRRVQLATFLLAGVLLGGGLVAAVGGFAGGGSDGGYREGVHRVADGSGQNRNDSAEMDHHDGAQHGSREDSDG